VSGKITTLSQCHFLCLISWMPFSSFVSPLTAMLCAPPQAMEMIFSSSSPFTAVGTCLSSLSPVPTCPKLFNPHARSFPSSVVLCQKKGKEKSEENKGNEETEEQGKQALSVVAGVFGFLTDFLITFVYIFFFIHFRSRFKKFILMLFEDSKQGEVRDIISKSTAVVQSYLFGRLILMVVLAVLYATGLSISGVDRVLFVSVISAVLSIIPFVGNFIGYGLAMVMGVISGGSALTLVGVTLTYAVVQFIETYILQPIILGGKLDIHPFFIILAVILGNAVWGVTGMILSLPLFAIVTII
jgi:predicted PurR-regulated permease PerM